MTGLPRMDRLTAALKNGGLYKKHRAVGEMIKKTKKLIRQRPVLLP